MQLLPRGLGGAAGDKAAPPDAQQIPPPLPPRVPTLIKPALPPKPQVRIYLCFTYDVCNMTEPVTVSTVHSEPRAYESMYLCLLL